MSTNHPARFDAESPRSREELAEGGQVSRGRPALAIYTKMLLWSFIASGVIIGALTVLMISVLHSEGDAARPFLPVVIFAGSLGAFFSALIRLYNFSELPRVLTERDFSSRTKSYLVVYSFVPGVVGGISATVLYVTFASELITGNLFPSFVCKAQHCYTFLDVIQSWSPNDPTDYSKAIVWGFIAGFAERLVPDTLRNLSHSMERSEAETLSKRRVDHISSTTTGHSN
jgi:hypothetical protein